MKWKITPADRKIIREYAAHAARLRPQQVGIMIAQRCSTVDASIPPNFNIKLVDPSPDWDDSDLHDKWMLREIETVELTPEGEAEVDFYIYSMEGFGPTREIDQLETNVQAHVRLVNGKPRIWKLTDTDFKAVILIPQTTEEARIHE
jgi:hypothetical protein